MEPFTLHLRKTSDIITQHIRTKEVLLQLNNYRSNETAPKKLKLNIFKTCPISTRRVQQLTSLERQKQLQVKRNRTKTIETEHFQNMPDKHTTSIAANVIRKTEGEVERVAALSPPSEKYKRDVTGRYCL